MAIEWVFPGATPEQKERAVAAALEVFKASHIDPEIAAFAKLEMQTFTDRGNRGPLPHKDSAKGALVFLYAQNAAAEASGLSLDALRKGHIRVDFEPGGWGAYFMRESRVLNWIDPDEPQTAPN